MAEPLTIVSLAATVIGGAMSAYGKAQQGAAQGRMFDYQAGIAQMNQKIALQNADYERNVGEIAAQESGMKTRAQVGATTAAQAASGLDVNAGSTSDVRTSETEIGQYNEAIIRANAARRAYGYDVEATQDVAQAGLYRMAASTSRAGGDIGAITSLLSMGTSVADKYLAARQKGLLTESNPTDVGSAITLGG